MEPIEQAYESLQRWLKELNLTDSSTRLSQKKGQENPSRPEPKDLELYRTVLQEAMERRYPLSENDRRQLESLQVALHLTDDEVRAIEQQLAAASRQPTITPSEASSGTTFGIPGISTDESNSEVSSPVNQSATLTLVRQKRQVQFFLERLDDEIAIEMMQIPAGTFLMGSPEDELERSTSEGPQHEVRISSFFMGKYPVTQAQWKVVANLPQVNRELAPDPSQFKGENRPVEQVSWYDAVEFCARLSVYTRREYRLPTEAEWEYACRAGTTTPFHFGETITTDLANYDGTDDPDGKWSGSYGRGPKGEYRRATTSVEHFGITNIFGLCDMHGNVWEWCLDHWHRNYEGAPTDGSTWLTKDETVNRVLRGGSWIGNPRACRSAYRLYALPNYQINHFGFRIVCSNHRTL